MPLGLKVNSEHSLSGRVDHFGDSVNETGYNDFQTFLILFHRQFYTVTQ